jgi:hypothetical protein
MVASGRKEAMMPTDSELAEAVALAHQMGYADGAAAARATVERLEARVAELEAALEAAQAYADAYVATATGPERDLADLERLARDNDGIAELRLAAWGLSVAWQPDARTFGYFPAYDSPLEEYTRAEALALLKGAKDAG